MNVSVSVVFTVLRCIKMVVARWLGAVGDFPQLNAMSKDDWREYYDIESAKLVYKIYKKRHTYKQQ